MATPEANPVVPKTFISYSWDDDAHKEWVKQLATRMRADGVDVTLDRWHSAPGDQIPAFMERAVRENDFVIAVCTPRFKERSDERGGGVGYEGDIMTAYAFTSGDKRKFIPVLRRGRWIEAGPTWLLGRAKIDLSGDPYSESEYEELLRTLHGAREAAPPIGGRPNFGDKKGSQASPSPAPVTLLAGSSTPQHQSSVTPKSTAVEAMTAVSPPPGVDVNMGAGEPDPSVSAAIGRLAGPGEEVRNSIRDSIERRLKRLGQHEVTKFPVLRDLERELRSADDDSEFPESKDPIPVILEALLDQRSLGNISGLSEIYDQRCKKSDWLAAEIVAEIIDDVTPLVIKPELAIRIWNEIKVRNTAMFFTPVDQSAAAEVLMACADRKGMKFKPPKEFPVKDFDGTPLLRGGGSSFGRPVTQESLAKTILLDLCEGQGVSESSNQPQTLDVLVERFAGILIDNSRGVNKGRTLYGFHKMPENPRDHPVHTDALTLIRDELAKTKREKPNEFRGLPGFVFLVLAQKSEHEGLQTVVVQVLKRRFEREKNRTAHAAND